MEPQTAFRFHRINVAAESRGPQIRYNAPMETPLPQRGLLTIETGPACNNRCIICPQQAIRSCRRASILSPAELRERIAWARAQGFDEVGLSGGEPTIRKDLAGAVEYARSIGFRTVQITSNGRMFSYPEFADRLVAAGLTGASITLQGPDAPVHEALTGAPGSFAQTCEGIRQLRRAADASGRPFHLSTVTVLVPGNLPHLGGTLRLAGRLGATLHLVQPFIVARENVHLAARFCLSRSEIVAGIEAAVAKGLPHGGRVKPFNIPPCDLAHLGEVVEVQDYRIRKVREHEPRDRDVAGHGVASQFFRDAACDVCDCHCPGIRLEHLPQTVAADAMVADIAAGIGATPGRDVIVGATDLLDARGLDRFLAGLRGLRLGRIRAYWGGFARTSADEFVDACRRHRIDEVCLVVSPPALRTPDRLAWIPGNLERLTADLSIFRPGFVPAPSLFVAVHALFSDDVALEPAQFDPLLSALAAAGGSTVFLALPEGLDPRVIEGTIDPPEGMDPRARDAIAALFARVRGAALRPVALDARPDAPAPQDPWDLAFVPHRFSGPAHAWVMWSCPPWMSRPDRAFPT